MLTVQQINAMTDEELHEYQRQLGHKIVKRLVVKTAVTVAVVAVVRVVVSRLENSNTPE